MLDKIRKLTEGNLTESGSKILRISQQYADKKGELDAQSYKNLKQALQDYNKEVQEEAEKHYFILAQDAQKKRDEGIYNEKQYHDALIAAQEEYDQTIETAAANKKEYLSGIEDEIIKKYQSATKEEKELLKGLFKDIINFDDIKAYEDSGKACVNKFIDGAEASIKSRPL